MQSRPLNGVVSTAEAKVDICPGTLDWQSGLEITENGQKALSDCRQPSPKSLILGSQPQDFIGHVRILMIMTGDAGGEIGLAAVVDLHIRGGAAAKDALVRRQRAGER